MDDNRDDAYYVDVLGGNRIMSLFMDMSEFMDEIAGHIPENIFLNMFNKLKECKDVSTYKFSLFAPLVRDLHENIMKLELEKDISQVSTHVMITNYKKDNETAKKDLVIMKKDLVLMMKTIVTLQNVTIDQTKQKLIMENKHEVDMKNIIKKHNKQDVAMKKTNNNLKEAIKKITYISKQKDQASLREQDRSNAVIGHVYKFMQQEKNLEDFDTKLQKIWGISYETPMYTSEAVHKACDSVERLSFIGHNLLLEFLSTSDVYEVSAFNDPWARY